LAVTELLSVLFGQNADALNAVGSTVIDLTPGPVKEWAISTFGTSDKLFLAITLITVIVVLAALAGLAETRRRPLGSAAIVVAGIAAAAAVLSRAGADGLDVIPVCVGTATGVAVLRLLTVKSAPDQPDPDTHPTDPQRRHWLTALVLLGVGVAGGVGGRLLASAVHSVAGERAAFKAPQVAAPAPPPVAEVQPTGVALPPFITPNPDFYRIDTALNIPQLPRDSWRLRIHGMVDREITLSFDDLAAFPVIEKTVTLTCVSNPVGGDLISNATWTGYRVRDLLSRTGIHPDADMVLSTSVDGFTAGTPVQALTDDRDALLAITMNGQPLPAEHGYPARLVVPGLYGYASATKWVVDLELTRFDRAKAYWTGLGWADKAPVKTASRIDVPKSLQNVPTGPVRFGGVAWAQNRGVSRVEVGIDNGEWRSAQLASAYSNDTWRLWSYDWNVAPSGDHTIRVRATDNTGALQVEQPADPMPDGATGWHTVAFSVG
jgi:DMSO/TMAO reductase YedYZ molybdopterin-dependent catalytic subunit